MLIRIRQRARAISRCFAASFERHRHSDSACSSRLPSVRGVPSEFFISQRIIGGACHAHWNPSRGMPVPSGSPTRANRARSCFLFLISFHGARRYRLRIFWTFFCIYVCVCVCVYFVSGATCVTRFSKPTQLPYKYVSGILLEYGQIRARFCLCMSKKSMRSLVYEIEPINLRVQSQHKT